MNKDWWNSESQRMGYVVSCLKGKAHDQVSYNIKNGVVLFDNVNAVKNVLQSAFGDIDAKATAQLKIFVLEHRRQDPAGASRMVSAAGAGRGTPPGCSSTLDPLAVLSLRPRIPLPEATDAAAALGAAMEDTVMAPSLAPLPIPLKIWDSVDPPTWGKISAFDPTDLDNTPEQIGSIIGYLIECYKRRHLFGQLLWEEINSDFEEWEAETFMLAPNSIIRYLREYLLCQGVFVATDGNRIANNVYEAVKRGNFRTWTNAEMTEVAGKNSTFRENLADPDFFSDISTPIRPYIPPSATTPVSIRQSPAISHQGHSSGYQDRPPVPAVTHRHTPPTVIPGHMPSPKQLTDLTKLYTDDMKYGGGMYDILESKLLIFRDNCHKAGIPHALFAGAFSIMLKTKALQFYFARLCNVTPSPDFHTMVSRVKQHFETEESRQVYLAEWRNTTFLHIIHENPDKTKMECLDLLLETLMKLRSAIGTATQSTNQQSNASDQYWTDRTYRGHGRESRFGQRQRSHSGIRPGSSSSWRPPGSVSTSSPRPTLPATPKKCYVCRKSGCWSTKHSNDERRRAYDSFRGKYQYTQDTSMPSFNHFLAWHEGIEGMDRDENDNDDPDAQYFQALGIADDQYGALPREESDESQEFMTSYFTGPVNGPKIVAGLADQAVAHALTKEDLHGQQLPDDAASVFSLEGRYSSRGFQGIMPDTGAAGFSTAGHPQFVALQREVPVTLDTSTAGDAKIRFGGGDPIDSIGTTVVSTVFGKMSFHVIPTDTPFLLCLEDMDRMGIQFDNIRNVLRQGTMTVPVIRKWGHQWMLLQPERSLAWNHLTDVELRRLHRRFGHPSVQRLHRVLQLSGHPVELTALEELTKICRHCQLHAGRPTRFKFTLRDDHEFNYEVIVDIMYLEGNKPVLHVVDSATSFNAARFLKDISAKQTWDTLRLCWIDVYQGPPDWIVTDAGKNFHSAVFKQSARSMAISVKEMPIEAHNSVGKVERYHAPLRRAYDIIRSEDPSTSPELALKMAVKSINDTAGPNGLVPTLLVFGSYPRMTDDSAPSPTTTQRVEAVRKATAEIRRLHARRQVTEALATRNGPDTTPTLALPLQSLVRVWREKQGWQGPFKLLATKGETCTLDLPQGPRDFRSTVIKPFYEDSDEAPEAPPCGDADNAIQPVIVVAPEQTATEQPQPAKRRPGRPRKNPPLTMNMTETDVCLPAQYYYLVFISSKEEADHDLAKKLRDEGILTAPGEPFEQSTKEEIDSLIGRGVFEFTQFDPARHAGVRIFKSRIVNEVKGKATGTPYEKSRLVIQGYADDGKEVILTQAPTIQRASQRLILAIAPSLLLTGKTLWLRDIT
ncbi:uncharacterized protein VDAG_04832 [Verticillium dahliae VdLs.17]|uniref:Integrase catalytic domain-containing protein n=1 Tax=Verticillium dahliae (strain VdLs.17 / ATCC MYA-4575 / FGSC 10137) TaxID=498257 RepID=G2X347_VERDV|nr:uncharacterized protein VDAG_04832 [Verticillium dahliae VdLs.17]EGY23394.1 hypothetical protein VDAG_04832 [Verticillium dahliae VdLs.17]